MGVFAQGVKEEVKSLGGCDVDAENQIAEGEISEFNYILFKDYWSRVGSALLDTAIYSGNLRYINIRRAYTQGAWALALRWLGSVARAAEAAMLEKELVSDGQEGGAEIKW
jgi:hypothetical protein